MSMAWNETLSIGNNYIDNQHKELFDKFNDLLQACKEARGKERIGQLLQFLDSYVNTHFRAEECLMMDCNYAEITDHKKEHEEFICSLAKLKKDLLLEGTTLGLIVQTNQILLKWIVRHIKSSDRALGDYLQRVQ